MNLIIRLSNKIRWKMKMVLLEVSLMKFNLRISNEIKCVGKVVLLEGSFMNFRKITQSILDELHSSDMQWDQMEGDSGVTRTIID